jgi:Kef-type K+ transport system membrane component KefB
MQNDPLVFTIFLIFVGAALMSTLALYARQALLVAYIVLGMLFGPFGLGLVNDPDLVRQISHVGIMFLLFLLGLNLPPSKLIPLFRETTLITGISSLVFASIGATVAWFFGYGYWECLIVGISLAFSSTIIGLKLLPTTVLHHKRTGEIIISILLIQDIIAIIVMLLLQAAGHGELPWLQILLRIVALPGLVIFAFLIEKFILVRLIARFDKIQEYIFLMAIAWCLGIAELSTTLGLSLEIGAFIAGVSIATSPISLYIGESLKPLRDFFLIIFFFSLGASFDFNMVGVVIFPSVLIAMLVLGGKPIIFKFLLRGAGEISGRSEEIGVRLGQISEFSLLIAVMALDLKVIGEKASYLIQVATLLTFIISSYLIVLRYPTPIAISDKLRRD